MPQNDLQPRIGIEQARSDQAKRVDRRLLSERPGRPEQPGMAGIDPGIFRQRIAGMQIEGNVELLDLLPERPILRHVIVDWRLMIGDLRKSVDQRAAESERLDTALEFCDRKLRVLHRKRRERLEARRTPGNLLGKIVVGAPRDFVGLGRLGDGPHGGRAQGQDHHFDAVLVHLGKPPVLNVEEPALLALGHETRGVHQRVGDGEMLFECDLALHRFLACVSINTDPGAATRAPSARTWSPRHPSSC
jgi:hypothetical protein